MKPKAGATLVAACGKEGIERLPLDVRCHADTIVGKNYLDVIIGAQARRDGNRTRPPIGERVIGSVEKKISQNLAVRAGKPIDNQTFRDIDSEVYRFPLYVSRQAVAWSFLGIIAAALVSGLIVRRKLDALDLVAVLKIRE